MALRSYAPLVLVAVFAGSMPARGQAGVVFADDVENGQLLHDAGGKWSYETPVAGNVLSASSAAAHRGQVGIQLLDSHVGNASGNEGELDVVLPAPLTSAAYLRFWFRVRGASAAGSLTFAAASQAADSRAELASTAAGLLRLGGLNHAGVYETVNVGTVDLSAWHLLEMELSGLGGTLGRRALWVDGALAGAQAGLDFSGSSVDRFAVGEPWSDNRSFTGAVQLDDVRVTTGPPASTLNVQAPTQVLAHACVPLRVGLVRSGSAQDPASAPYAVDVAVELQGPAGVVFSDAECRQPAHSVVIPTDAAYAAAAVRWTGSGPARVLVSHPDFFPAQVSAEVSAVGEDAPLPKGFVGWGCQSGSGAGWVGIFIVGAWALGRRGR